ncbi:hypothetical protein [Cellulomonas aerilata]|uniref:Uncharacterized protein n=1 Tax=Cellulomonas aerilata TaxID=515326 RepID=A0A512D9Q0_9CELL|nr:hypothetical protein [Cellulomonas aerilata]GEO33155.1 hypothetical protein CAE01nite_08800 [Cellulomonas aerilata]
MDMLLWGPGLDAELEFRRERVASMWGRPAWADRVAGTLPAHRRAPRHVRAPHGAARHGVVRAAAGEVTPGPVAVR